MPTGEAILPATSAQRVLGAICSKLTHCFAASGALSEQSCRTAVLGTSSIDTELGLPAGYGTYQAIVDAERAGSIRPEAAATDACVSEIGALSCESPAVQSAYSSASPADYTNVEQIFSLSPSSCGGIYPGG